MSLLFGAKYAKCPYYLVLYIYEKCPYCLVLYTQSVLITLFGALYAKLSYILVIYAKCPAIYCNVPCYNMHSVLAGGARTHGAMSTADDGL